MTSVLADQGASSLQCKGRKEYVEVLGEGSRNPFIWHCHQVPHIVEPQPEVLTSKRSNLLKKKSSQPLRKKSSHLVMS